MAEALPVSRPEDDPRCPSPQPEGQVGRTLVPVGEDSSEGEGGLLRVEGVFHLGPVYQAGHFQLPGQRTHRGAGGNHRVAHVEPGLVAVQRQLARHADVFRPGTDTERGGAPPAGQSAGEGFEGNRTFEELIA